MPSRHAQAYRLLALIFPEWILDILPLKRNQELRSTVRTVRNLIRKTISEEKDEKSALKTEHRNDIISAIQKDGDVLDTDMLVNQCLTFLGAGHDTISQSLNWGIYELSINPDIQTKLREEVQESLPGASSPSTPDSEILERVDTMPYLIAVCNEILRLHPPIHHLHRQALQPVTLNNQTLPKGSKFIISINAMNHSPDLWSEDPTKFNPDRWLQDPSGGAKDRQAFLSFSQGPRSCIGEKFGRAEMAFILAGLVQNFEMEFVGTGESGESREIALEYGTVTRFEGSMRIRFKPVIKS